ncbi:MAG: TolC family protein [Chlorobium sp.]|nr:MAG: TolC family protein [Chlorobium sp.]
MVSRFFLFLIISALFLAQPCSGVGSEVKERTLSLSDCIELALNNATTAKKAKANLKLQGSDVLRSYGNFLPKVSVSATYTPSSLSQSYVQYYPDAPPLKIKSESGSANLALTTSLNLFNGFSDYASLQSALNKEQAAGYTLSRALQTIVYDVTQYYYQVLMNRELLDIAKENLLSIKNQLTLTDRQFQIGLKSRTDLFQQQAAAAESSMTVIQAETRMQRSTLELLRRLQIDPRTRITLDSNPKELNRALSSKPDIDALVTIALERRSDLKSKELETRAAKWQITQSRSAWYPHLALNANASTAGTDYLRQSYSGSTIDYSYPSVSDQLRNSIGYSVGLNLSWSIFDGFQTSYNVQSAKVNHLNQKFDYDDLKNNIALDLQQAANDYASALMQIETSKVSLTASSSAFEDIKRKYELGATGFVELSTARASLFNARSNLSQATYNLALQKNVLDYATGTIPITIDTKIQ